MMAGLQDLTNLLLTGGRLALNPELKTGLDSKIASVNRATAPLTKKLAALESKMTTWSSTVSRLEAKQGSGTALTKSETKQLAAARKNITKNQSKVDEYNSLISAQNQRVTDYMENEVANAPSLTSLIDDKFPEFKNALSAAQPYLEQMGKLGPAGERLMSALEAGYQANNITPQQVEAQMIEGVKMADFGSARAVRADAVADVERGQLGQSLMNRAMTGIDRAGRLSDQQTRDAVQSARQAFSARGLVTGNAALGAELLNRDRYARVREFEDLGFAQQVQGQDLERQAQNQSTALGLSLANQQAGMQAELANLQARYNQAVQEGDWAMAAQKANQVAALEASTNNATLDFNAQQFNETNRMAANQYNTSMLGDAYNLQQGVLGEGLRAVDANFQLTSKANPNNLMLQLYGSQPNFGAEALSSTTNTANNAANNSVIAQGFNSNMFAGLQIADMNNKAALQSSNIAAGANRYAANMGLAGSTISAVGSIAGGGLAGR
jgi:peptidoglycan hydrolase CwlO-like protein